MKHESATAWPLLCLCLYRNRVWQLVVQRFLNISTDIFFFFLFKNGKPDLSPVNGTFTQQQQKSERREIWVAFTFPANLKISRTSPAEAFVAMRSFSDYWCVNLAPRWLRLCWRSHWVHQQTQRNGCTNRPTYDHLPTLIILAWQT